MEDKIIANLSHSYFNHLLKDVQPFLEYFNDCSSWSFEQSNHEVDSEILERLFFMACLNSKDLSLPFNFSAVGKIDPKIKKHDWLTDLKPFGSKSKQGVVHKSLIFDKFYIVVKKAKSSKFDQITLRDFCVGINLNKILNEAPFFVRTLGCFQFKNQFHIVTEYIDGINLKTFIRNKRNTFTQFLNIFFQILLGLELAQNKLNFSHYDLHTDNVLLVPQKHSFEISLHGYNYTIKNDYKPVMIDFGLSSLHTKGQTLGQKSLETKGIFNHLSPGYDIYVFLLFCVDTAHSSNMSIHKGITDLLLFFKLEKNISMDLLTNNHIKSLHKGISNLIPNQFIKYLMNNYSNQLNVEIHLKSNNEKCLGKRPLTLRLKQVLDTNDELVLEIKKNHTNGFIKSLMNNIKIYYWYQVKNNLTQNEIDSLIQMDMTTLQNLLDDLNLRVYDDSGEPSITIEQKNLFFVALDYFHLILELELQHQHSFYKEWISDFKKCFVFKNIFRQLDKILYEERVKKIT